MFEFFSQSLLSMHTAKELENKKVNDEILELLTASTAKVIKLIVSI